MPSDFKMGFNAIRLLMLATSLQNGFGLVGDVCLFNFSRFHEKKCVEVVRVKLVLWPLKAIFQQFSKIGQKN